MDGKKIKINKERIRIYINARGGITLEICEKGWKYELEVVSGELRYQIEVTLPPHLQRINNESGIKGGDQEHEIGRKRV